MRKLILEENSFSDTVKDLLERHQKTRFSKQQMQNKGDKKHRGTVAQIYPGPLRQGLHGNTCL